MQPFLLTSAGVARALAQGLVWWPVQSQQWPVPAVASPSCGQSQQWPVPQDVLLCPSPAQAEADSTPRLTAAPGWGQAGDGAALSALLRPQLQCGVQLWAPQCQEQGTPRAFPAGGHRFD